MNIFFTYVILGISLSAPMGPINAAQLEKGVKSGFFHSWLIGFGAMAADMMYMLLIYFGLAHYLNTPFMKTFLWAFGCFVLIYTGIENLLNIEKSENNRSSKDESMAKSFFSGFLMTLTNPLSILFWLGIYGSILAKTVESYSMRDVFFYSLGIFLGILIWDIFMAAFASTLYKWGSTQMIRIVSSLSSISLIGFGIYFGYQAVKALFM